MHLLKSHYLVTTIMHRKLIFEYLQNNYRFNHKIYLLTHVMYEVRLTTLVTIKRQMTHQHVWLTPPVTSGRQMTLRQVYLSRGYPSPAGHRGRQLHLLVSHYLVTTIMH